VNALATETLAALLAGPGRDATALVCPEDGVALTLDQLAEAVDHLSRRLSALGVERGGRVALSLPNGPEIVVALLALARLGAAAAPFNPAYTAREFRFYLEDIRPRLLLLPRGGLPAAREAAAGIASVVELAPGQDGELEVSLDGRSPLPSTTFEEAQPDDVALLLHTSGTTGRPKLVPLLHRNLMATSHTIAAHYRLGSDDRSYCAMPLFHVHGVVASVFSALLAGGSVVVPRRLARRSVLSQLATHEPTWLSASPTVYHMLLEADGNEAAPVATELRFLRSCSSALAPELMARVERRFGVPLLEAYGMTEAGHQIASNPLPPEAHLPESVGIPTGTEIRVVDAHWRMLAAGEVGEVAIRGPGITPGYVENAEANAEAFDGGWFRTGDLGSVDERGYLRLLGRRKEIIVRGGENISPLEVEQALVSHPAVADAVCFGLPDEKYGETVAVAVVLRAPCEEHELVAHCREGLAAFKVPHSIDVVEAIPRTPTGKLQRARMAGFLGKV
jgi:acyl-CoA synthetase (AMP-forming)/AMP-acid ligase II